MWRIDKSLRVKVLAGMTLSVIILVALPLIFTSSAMEQRESARWVAHTYDVLSRAQSIRALLRESEMLALGRRLESDPRLDDSWRRAGDRLQVAFDELQDFVRDNPSQQAKAREIGERVRRSRAQDEATGQGGRPSKTSLSDLILEGRATETARAIEGLLDEFVKEERRLLDDRLKESEQADRSNLRVIRIGSALAIGSTLFFSLWLVRSLVGPIRDLTDAARRIQEGNLDARVSETGRDELGQLGSTFNGMAIALQKNARELEKRDVQAGVLRVTEVLSSNADLAPLLDTALERILDVAQCQAGAIYLRSPDDVLLRPLVVSGVSPGLLEQVIQPGEGLLGRAARGGVPLFVPGDSEAAPISIAHWLGPQRPAELAYLPLRAGSDLIGVVTLAKSTKFDDRTRNVLWIVAGHLGASFQNALSHRTLQRQAVELESRNARLAENQAAIERSNKDLRAASQLKSEFLANMSHELRTPLTIILGFSDALLRGSQGDLNSEQKAGLKRVYDNGQQLLTLINDILDLSKIEAGQMEMVPGPTSPRALVRSIGENFLDMAKSRGLDLRVETDPGLPEEISTDEPRLRQILVNLVSNAIKFTERGEVVLSVRRTGSDGCEFEVRDTGPGIASEDMPKIFEQFRQLDGRTTRKAGGTGLGLSIVRRLVDLLGGTLDVRSQLGSGTSFVFRLPYRSSPPAVPKRTESPMPSVGTSGVVLAIDDDEDFLNLLRESLKGTSLILHTATSGSEGLELAVRLRPDVITLDVMMTDMDGWSVLNALKTRVETAEIPVIILTVFQRRGLGLILGAADFLSKPLDREHLLRALHRAGALRETGPVLVIDDDPDIRDLLSRELTAGGYRVRVAANGPEGLRMAQEQRPSAVILDLMMPEMDGFEVASSLHAERGPNRDVPILVLTAKELSPEDVRRLNGRIEEIVPKGTMKIESLISRLVTTLQAVGVPRPTRREATSDPR